MKNQSEVISGLRNRKLEGDFIRLAPVEEKHLPKIVRLRNREVNKYFLNQDYDLTNESQKAWYEEYLKHDDDICWCIERLLDGRVIGTVRLYNYSLDMECCEHGSFIIDKDVAKEAPYAVEAMVMSLDAAFDLLGVAKIINQDREDNKIMNSLTHKAGFEYIKAVEIRGIPYKFYELSKENYLSHRPRFASAIELWKSERGV